MTEIELVSRNYLLYFIMPLWIACGLLDWRYHRVTHIEKTSGTKESLIHMLMMVEVGIPVFLGLFTEINAGMILIITAAMVVHSLTAVWDVRFADKYRRVRPAEQHVHSGLEMLPFVVASFLICIHWQQLFALVGIGNEPAHFMPEWKHHMLPASAIVGLLGALGTLLALPYVEELVRCLRHSEEARAWQRSEDERRTKPQAAAPPRSFRGRPSDIVVESEEELGDRSSTTQQATH